MQLRKQRPPRAQPIYSVSGRSLELASTQFAFELFSQLASSGANLVLSPYGLRVALALLWAGSTGETRKEMEVALRLGDTEAKHGQFEATGQPLTGVCIDTVAGEELITATALWCDQELRVLPEYQRQIEEDYKAEIRVASRSTQSLGSEIGNWIHEQTRGKISVAVPGPTKENPMLLVNAVYFRGCWRAPFKETMTRPDDFLLENGAPQKVMMMRKTEYFPYAEHDGTQIVDLPYWGGMRMRVFLPGGEKSFRQFCRGLYRVPARFLNGVMETREVSLSLPRFRIESDVDLRAELRTMGMQRVFCMDRAELDDIAETKPLFLGGARHCGYIDVNETGTEAAAATILLCGAARNPPPPIEMRINRPFVFAILDGQMNTVMFLGAVANPQPART